MNIKGEFKMGLKQKLADAIYNELKFKDHIIKHFLEKYPKNYSYYYENKYADPVINGYKKRKSEWVVGKKNGLIRGCSIASSARLCFLYFYDDILKDSLIELEKKMNNDLKKGGPSYMDAYSSNGNIYYEAKCQEITDAKGLLSVSYKDSNLFKDFGVDENKITFKKNKIQFPISELGIQDIEDICYNKLTFDLKQLICHLIALAYSDKTNNKTLQYLFFTPSKDAIENNKDLKKLYDKLDKEIEAIWNSNKIKDFCVEHHILLAKPKFIEINFLEDKVYPNVKWKKIIKTTGIY